MLSQSDFWVLSLSLLLLPLFGWAVWYAPDFSPAEEAFHIWGIGSLRATWAVYCGHALSHGRWARQVGRIGSAKFNAALAIANAGHLFQVIPSYWIMHASHHTKLGTLPLREARHRAQRNEPTDGDLGIATRLFSPPARRYNLVLERESEDVLPRQSEVVHQLIGLRVHAIAPVAFAGYLAAALRADSSPSTAVTRTALAVQAAASLVGYALVLGVCLHRESAAPLLFYLASSVAWLSPLNPNWIWTSPHLCEPSATPESAEAEEAVAPQPTVSFYTPDNALGAMLDVYMGYENYHVEHHDFPELPMYLLPRLRRQVAPAVQLTV